MALVAMAFTQLCIMGATGAANIPGTIAQINQQQATAKTNCRMATWCTHRVRQLEKLTKMLNNVERTEMGPAVQLAQATQKNWEMSKQLAKSGEVLFKVNLGVLSITMIVYVLVAYLILFRKRNTLNQAFSAVSGWQF